MKLHQYLVTMKLEFSRIMEYRINFLFRLGVNSIIPLIIKICLFEAFFLSRGGEAVAGYDSQKMLIYQLWGALVILLIEIRTTIDNVTFDIRFGRITRYLLYPIGMFEIITCQYLAAFVLQSLCFCGSLALMCWWFDGFVLHWQAPAFWLAFAFVFLGSVFWYLIHFTIGLAAFWLEEVWTFFIIFQMVSRFLSGNPIPLDMFPQGFENLSQLLPFHWMFFAPVKMFSEGIMVPNALTGLGVLLFWCLVVLGIHFLIWRSGLRRYSAAGM